MLFGREISFIPPGVLGTTTPPEPTLRPADDAAGLTVVAAGATTAGGLGDGSGFFEPNKRPNAVKDPRRPPAPSGDDATAAVSGTRGAYDARPTAVGTKMRSSSEPPAPTDASGPRDPVAVTGTPAGLRLPSTSDRAAGRAPPAVGPGIDNDASTGSALGAAPVGDGAGAPNDAARPRVEVVGVLPVDARRWGTAAPAPPVPGDARNAVVDADGDALGTPEAGAGEAGTGTSLMEGADNDNDPLGAAAPLMPPPSTCSGVKPGSRFDRSCSVVGAGSPSSAE
jgi:hypothetical protein